MNGRQAKKLRRAALGLAATLTEAGRDIKKDGYVVQRHHDPSLSPSSLRKDINDKSQYEDPFNMPTYQIQVREDSVKGIYKTLKKEI
jgi:hypothetical protein